MRGDSARFSCLEVGTHKCRRSTCPATLAALGPRHEEGATAARAARAARRAAPQPARRARASQPRARRGFASAAGRGGVNEGAHSEERTRRAAAAAPRRKQQHTLPRCHDDARRAAPRQQRAAVRPPPYGGGCGGRLLTPGGLPSITASLHPRRRRWRCCCSFARATRCPPISARAVTPLQPPFGRPHCWGSRCPLLRPPSSPPSPR